MIEIVQGEGGFEGRSQSRIAGVAADCDETGILLIIDEVQTGFGRTGRLGAAAHYDIVPDISTWAKSLGSGMPIGAVIGKAVVLDSISSGYDRWHLPRQPGVLRRGPGHYPVYGKNRDQCQRQTRREYRALPLHGFEKKISRSYQQCPGRFLGAMMAFELSHEGDILRPNGDLCKRLTQRCYEKGLVLISSGVHGNVIRVLSPLVIRGIRVEGRVDIIEAALGELDVPAALRAARG